MLVRSRFGFNVGSSGGFGVNLTEFVTGFEFDFVCLFQGFEMFQGH